MSVLLFDIGATKTRLALAGLTMPKRVRVFPTPHRWTIAQSTFEREIKKVIGQKKVTSVIGGTCGTLDASGQRLKHVTNIPDWSGKPLGAMIVKASGAKKVRIENDANVAALGEAVYGAGRGCAIVGYLGLGTGVGGARIVNGQLDLAKRGFRPGHHILDASSKVRCACGQYGDLEGLVSGSGLERQYHRPANTLPAVAYRRAARYLGIAVNNLATMWTPDVVVLGGSVMSSLWPYHQGIKKELRYRSYPPQIVRARLGDLGGLYGALALM